MRKIPIWIVAIEHRHGMDLSAASSEDRAHEIIRAWVDQWWSHEMDKVPGRKKDKAKPKDPVKMVQAYFAQVEEESFVIELSDLELEAS